MIPATPEQQALFERTTFGAPYNLPITDEKNKLVLFELDEIPQPDVQGRIKGEGYKASWTAIVDPAWTNFVGAMHGAAAAWIVDTCTGAAIVCVHTDTFWGPPMLAGVSLNLNVDYFHPAPAGTKIRITCEIVRLTPTIANLTCEIRDFDTGKLFSTGTHLKTWRPGRQAKL